jgi:ferredoxin
MSDPTRSLLRWLAAHDLPRRLTVVCHDAAAPRVARGGVLVRLTGCVKDEGLALPAQVLASGVEAVEVADCGPCPAGSAGADAAARRRSEWAGLFPGGVRPHITPRRGRARPAPILRLGHIAIPRRALLGLGRRDRPALTLDRDETARTLDALRLLAAQSRVDLGRLKPPAVPTLAATGAPAWGAGVPVVAANPTRHPGPGPGASTLAAPALGSPALSSPALASPALALAAEGCTACGVCVRACPHGALNLAAHDGADVLTHTPDLCRGEGACLALCPPGALTSAGPLSFGQLLDAAPTVIAEVATAACAGCGAGHPTGDGALCPACAFRTEHPFGAAPPPALARRRPSALAGGGQRV